MVKEGYKETILGTLPKDWRVDLVDECCEILDKHREPLNQKERDEIPGDIPYYGANGIVDYVGEYIFDEKLILLAEDGGHFEEYRDRPIAYIIEGKSWVNNHAHVLKPKDKYHLEWIYYTLVHKNILPFVYGSTRMKLNQKSLKTIPVQIPPLSEQEKIASILSSVDKLIEKTDEVIEETKELKKGLMQELLTKGIGHNEFKEVKVGPKIYKIPINWTINNLNPNKGLTKKVTDGSHHSPTQSDDGQFHYATVTNLSPDGIDFNSCNRINKDAYDNLVSSGCKPEINDVLFSKDGTVGISAVFDDARDVVLLSSIAIIRLTDNINPYYLKYYLSSRVIRDQIKSFKSGTAIRRVVLRDIKKFKIMLPSIDEQKKIASILSSVDAKIKKEEEYKAKLERLKKGLMQKLLTGEIRVNTEMEV